MIKNTDRSIDEHSSHAVTEQLRIQVDRLLGDSLGAWPEFLKFNIKIENPYVSGVLDGSVYFLIFCVFLYFFVKDPNLQILKLSAWAAAYIMFAATTARICSNKVLSIIESAILPRLNTVSMERISTTLADRYPARRVSMVALFSAGLAWLGSVVAIARDLHASYTQIFFWSVGFYFLYYLAARATYVSLFYTIFSREIRNNQAQIINVMDKNKSILIRMSDIGMCFLLFWLGIAISIITIPFLFYELRSFVLFVVPTASFFSLVVGAAAFLENQRYLDEAKRRSVESLLIEIENENLNYSRRITSLTDKELSQLTKYDALYRDMSDRAYTKKFSLSVLSVLIPLAGPIVSVWKVNSGDTPQASSKTQFGDGSR
ncbi:hypothetical protein [Methylopila sp. M107]|uniref:hypothetical protein n=1 Tax=Methylopila sp. M107 TaxID=1101190 RepID=UPI0012DC2628|nr:hypothetical protein [Methylopila sp. M107]